jgi:hypothetical protein
VPGQVGARCRTCRFHEHQRTTSSAVARNHADTAAVLVVNSPDQREVARARSLVAAGDAERSIRVSSVESSVEVSAGRIPSFEARPAAEANHRRTSCLRCIALHTKICRNASKHAICNAMRLQICCRSASDTSTYKTIRNLWVYLSNCTRLFPPPGAAPPRLATVVERVEETSA